MTTTTPSVDRPAAMASKAAPSVGVRLAALAGLALQLVVGVFVAPSGLLMPAWAVIGMVILWIGALVVALRHRRRPVVVLTVPLATFAVWYLTGTLGERFLGWTG